MKKIRSILFLHSFGKTLPASDLVSLQRFRLFKITTLFALIIFAGAIYQLSVAKATDSLIVLFIYALFVLIFVNYFALVIHKSPETAYIIFLGLGFAVLHACTYGQGGIRNSGMFYLAALILAAYMLLGKTGGKVMAGISIIHIVYFYFLSIYTDWTDYSNIGTEPGLIDIDFLITGALSILMLTAQATYIEKSKNAIMDDIKSKKDELVINNTQLTLTQKDLEIKNKELEEKNKELEQFAYVASHDLQEPLRTTSSFVELLQQQYKGKLDEKADKYLSYITQSSGRMEVLIKDLLDYSRIGQNKELQKIDCNKILQDVLEDLGTAIQETQANIKGDPLPVIWANPTEIKQLFQNLIANAIKFRKKDVNPEIRIFAQDLKGYWEFSCADNGIGISDEHRERIFVIFQRLHTRNEYEGSGIGLAHCKKIVELHGGKIWLKSVLGGGSTFYFTLQQNNV
ncbi:MAG: ATP-binding protein [Chitinophagaceae bacterium]